MCILYALRVFLAICVLDYVSSIRVICCLLSVGVFGDCVFCVLCVDGYMNCELSVCVGISVI